MFKKFCILRFLALFIFCIKAEAGNSPIELISYLNCEDELSFIIELKNVSTTPVQLKNYYVEEKGRWISGALFVSDQDHNVISYMKNYHFRDDDEFKQSEAVVDIQPDAARRITIVLGDYFDLSNKKPAFVVYGPDINVDGESYAAAAKVFNIEKYCSGENNKHSYDVVKVE